MVKLQARPKAQFDWRALPLNGPVLAFGALVLVAALMGGSARGDVQSLMILRPVAALLLGFGLWMLQADDARRYKVPLLLAAAVVALPILQLVPLPFSLWSHLPGREQIAEIDRVAGLANIARPLSLVPEATFNAACSLLIPAAALVLAIQFDRTWLERLLPLCLVLALISAMLGVLQLLGDRGGPLYLYEITNPAAAVGLFANRNHQATLLALALPMAVLWGTRPDPGHVLRKFVAVAAIAVLLPLILITGSRAGLIAAAAGLVAALVLLPSWSATPAGVAGLPPRISRTARITGWFAVVTVPAGLAAATVLLGRAEAWDRLWQAFATKELRFEALPAMLDVASRYWPVGTGMGSFERVYQASEPDRLLSPVFLNHAHNDWLELIITGGLPATGLLMIAIGITFYAAARRLFGTKRLSRPDPYWQLGLIVIVIFGIVCLSDYPLRTPLLQVIFVVAVVWAACPESQSRPMADAKIVLFPDRNGNKQGR